MTDIKYSIINAEDISAAMKSSTLSLAAGRKKDKNDSIVWDQTVSVIMERVDLTEVSRDPSKEGIKKNREYLQPIMANHILAKVTIPETGKNRQGKDFTIEGKNGIQWSSWAETRRIWDYLGSIAKVLAFSKEGLLYPEKYKVAARCDILAQCKETEAPIASVRRLSKDLQGHLDAMDTTPDILEAHKLTSGLTVNNLDLLVEARDLIARLDGLISVAEDTDLADIQADLLKMATKHFE